MQQPDDGFHERHEKFVRANRVIFLGAGFSAEAGIPMTGPLLAQTMSMFARECPGIFSRVEGYARDAFSAPETAASSLDFSRLSFADLCTFLEYIELKEYGGGERWSDSGSREKLAFRFYLAKTILTRTPTKETIPEIYREFAKRLRPSDVVVTFNWDCLLETALEAVGKEFCYPSLSDDSDDREHKLCIYKLHGSVNWRFKLPRREQTLDWTGMGFTTGMMRDDVYVSMQARNQAAWKDHSPLGEIEPLLVLPGAGKAFDVRVLAPLWYKPENAFGYTHDVYIIGLSLSLDDFFIRSFFLANLPNIEAFSGIEGRRIRIINPDPAVRTNYAFLLGQPNVEFLCEPLGPLHLAMFDS
ncbi:MAG: SIR2 family protein [Gemmatimonas sp.]